MTRRTVKYRTLRGLGTHELDAAVETALELGWVLYGDPYAVYFGGGDDPCIVYLQAVVKEADDE